MALVPRLASTPAVPAALPFSGSSTVAGTSAVSPVETIEPTTSTTDGESYYFEQFDLDREFDDASVFERRRRNRKVVSSLFVGSAQSFADAFAQVERGTTTNSGKEKQSLAFFRMGSEVYIANMHVVNDDLPKRGEELSFML